MKIKKVKQCCIQKFFGRSGNTFSLAYPQDSTLVGIEVQISKICLSGLTKIAFP